MRTLHLGNYLVDTDVFMAHAAKHIPLLAPHKDVPFPEPIIVHGVNIEPYVRLLNTMSYNSVSMFWERFNNLLKADHVVSSPSDIKDKTTLLCWVYFVQDSFL